MIREKTGLNAECFQMFRSGGIVQAPEKGACERFMVPPFSAERRKNAVRVLTYMLVLPRKARLLIYRFKSRGK
jgi:hypothetical protein